MAASRAALACAIALLFGGVPSLGQLAPAPGPLRVAPTSAVAPGTYFHPATPPPSSPPPPPPPQSPPSGQEVTATWLISRTLTSYEVVEFKMALVQLLAPYGVVSGDVQIGAPEAATRVQSTHTGRRLLQSGYEYYQATIQVPGNTTAKVIADYVSSDTCQMGVKNAVASNGGDYSVQLYSVSEGGKSTSGGFSPGAIAAIVICASVLVVGGVCVTAFFVMRRRSSKGRYALQYAMQ